LFSWRHWLCWWSALALAVCFRNSYGGVRESLGIGGAMTSILVGAVFICMVISIVVATLMQGISVKYSAFQTTIDIARSTPGTSEFELAALTQKAGEMNADLAGKQFWAQNPLTNWFYSKIILEIKPIR